MTRRRPPTEALAAAALALAAAFPAPAQTMLDQEQRLLEIHALLLDLPATAAPGSYARGQLGVGLEAITVPNIDGTTGTKRQITASDRTRVFPRPRLAYGLPAPEGFRAFVGLSYIPPLEVRQVSVDALAAEAGLAWAPGPLRLGLRLHGVRAVAQSPVTDPMLRDTLRANLAGADLAGGVLVSFDGWSVTPYGGAGLTRLWGRFRVTSDEALLTSYATVLALQAGARVLVGERWEGVVELGWFPGRLMHPNVRLAYLFDLGPRP